MSPRVLVPNIGGEELDEAPARVLAGVGDQGWQSSEADTRQATGFDADDLGAHGWLSPLSGMMSHKGNNIFGSPSCLGSLRTLLK